LLFGKISVDSVKRYGRDNTKALFLDVGYSWCRCGALSGKVLIEAVREIGTSPDIKSHTVSRIDQNINVVMVSLSWLHRINPHTLQIAKASSKPSATTPCPPADRQSLKNLF
jgi:hypothetical protein